MNTLNELFERDPAEMTDAELEKIIVYLREKREKWTQEEKEEKASRKKQSPEARFGGTRHRIVREPPEWWVIIKEIASFIGLTATYIFFVFLIMSLIIIGGA